MIRGCIVLQWPHAGWRAKETIAYSVQEAENLRKRRASDTALSPRMKVWKLLAGY
jgi:hypothetical protein